MTNTIISNDTVWHSGEIHDLNGQVQIAFGATLTIEGGVQVTGGAIDVFGTLNIEGTSNSLAFIKDVEMGFGSNNPKQFGQINISFANIIGGSILPANGNGGFGSINITDSSISNSHNYEYLWYPTSDVHIERNIFYRSGGLSIGRDYNVSVYIRNNVFVEQDGYAIENWASYDSGKTIVENNSFLSTDRTALVIRSGYTGAAIYAANNYFGTTDISTINNMIIDKTDDLAAASIISNSHINTPSSGTPSFYNEPTGTVSIGGNAIQGQVLTATNNLQDVDGMGVISYNWNADGIKIPGAINNSFLLTSDQVGKTITVIANYIDGHKSAESVSSPATNSVANSPGTNHNDNLIGTTSNDTLFGFSGNDTLKGLGGNDVLDGGAGNDTYYVDSKKDQVIEAAKIASGTDIIISTVTIANLAANVENLTLVGTNTLNATGNSLVNQIKGNAGNNNLNGGLGNDILTGGDGNDLFIFNTKIGANNVETITDFTIGVDKIALDDAIFKRLKGDKDLSDNFINGLFSLDKNDYLIYNPADGKVSYDSDGSGLKSAPVTIALIGLGINVTADDFIIV